MTGYFGSKDALGLYHNIIAMMPPHDTYIETHLGGGAVMRKKPPARNNIALDIDPEPLAAFDCGYPVQKLNECAHRYLREYDFVGSELIYCDPPYLIETRTSKRRYRYDYSRQDHVELGSKTSPRRRTRPPSSKRSRKPSGASAARTWSRPPPRRPCRARTSA